MRATRHHRSSRPATLGRSLDRSGALLLITTAGLVLAVLALVSVVVSATPARAAVSRTLNGDYPVDGARRLELGVPFGEVRVEGTDGQAVRVRVHASCDDGEECGDFVKGLRLESRNRGGTLHLKLEGMNLHQEWNLGDDEGDESEDARGRHRDRGDRRHRHRDNHIGDIAIVVEVPRSLQVDLNVGAGEVNVEGLRKDLSIDLGAGEISVRMLERHVGSVDVNMAVGETMIHQGGRTREYTRVLGGPVRWREGKGDAGIDVNIGAGEVDVTLE